MRPVPVAIAGSVIWLTALLTAQQSQSPPPRFRGGVELVQFDVTVLDRDRKPVQGLTAADFTVRDNGEVRPIVSFTPVTLLGPAPVPAKWATSFASDVVTNASTEGRLVVVLLDRNIAYGRAAQTARELGAAIVDQQGSGDLASVVHTAHLNGDCPCGVCSVDTVAHIARLLATAGPRQKTIFFIGSGIATAIDPPGEKELVTTSTPRPA